MKRPKWIALLLLVAGAATLAMPVAAFAADVRVMISAGFYHVYAELGPAFERVSGQHLIATRGPSMGDSPEAIPAHLARGEAADAVILDAAAADRLASRGLLRADTKVTLARSLIGMVVRQGAARPDIGSADAFRSTLLSARSVAYSDSGSGTYLSTQLFAKLGVAESVLPKSRKVRGPPSGEPVAAVVARGEAEIGFQQVSELMHVAGVDYVGSIPAELQPGFAFAGVLTPSAGRRGSGRAAALPQLARGGRRHLEGRTIAGGGAIGGRRVLGLMHHSRFAVAIPSWPVAVRSPSNTRNSHRASHRPQR